MYTRGLKAGWGQPLFRAAEGILKYVLRRFSFRPLGGSVTTFSDRCKKEQQSFVNRLSGVALWLQSHIYTPLRKACGTHFTLYRHYLTWRIPTGNSGVEAVVSQRRKSGCGLVRFSRAFSRDCSQRMSRWTFCSISQWPRVDAVSSS